MQIEIGSNFWDYSLSCHRKDKFWWEADEFNKIYLKSGRNAFKAICNHISKTTTDKRVLFPAYHCETESDPWYEAGWEVMYYPVEKNFTVDCLKLQKFVAETTPAVLVIQSYFGFEALDDECDKFLKSLKSEGIIIIEDITQSVLSDIKHDCADYYVASFRKFFAIPDGGVLISKSMINIGDINQSDQNLTLSAVQAYSLKKEYFETKEIDVKEQFRKEYVSLNGLISVNDALYAMSDFSKKILESIDREDIGTKRRRNFMLLAEGFKKIESLEINRNILCDSTVPLFLPVLMETSEERADLQAFLAKHNIYCPIIWKMSPRIMNCPIESKEIYSRILCFPIDQRYDTDDMQRVIETVKEWKKKGKKIMILGGGSNQIGLLQSARSYGYNVILCDKNPNCRGKDYSDVFYPVDIIDTDAIKNIAIKENISGIISNSEVVMEVVAEVSSALGLIGNSKESIAVLNSKRAFRDFQQKNGIYAPKHRSIVNEDELEQSVLEFDFPIIVKPVKCSGTRGTTRFDENNFDLIKAAVVECINYSRDKTCEIEEFVKMPSLIVLEGDVFIHRGKFFWGGLFFTRRSEKLPMVPMTYMSPYVDSDKHMNVIKKVLSDTFLKLGIRHGQYNVEAYFDGNDNFFIIEINARQGGHGLPAYVKLATGVDMDKLLVTTAVGDDEYFNDVLKNDIKQRFATRHAVFGDKDGILKDIYISEEISKYVINVEYDKKIGEKVEKRKNGSSVIGFVNLVFSSYEEQHKYSERMEDYIYPQIE